MSSISNSTNRVAGLVSGLETEELVKAMTANTKNRLNSKKQKLQTLEWKQEGYRSIIDKIADFKDKYLNILSSSSIKANAIMKKCKAESSNDKIIAATASSGATAAKYTISKAAAAKTASVSTTGAAADGGVKLDFSKAVSGKNYEVEVTLDGAKKTIVFAGGKDEAESKANFLTAANLAFDDIKKNNQSFKFDGDEWLEFNGNGDGIYHTFTIGKCEEGMGLTRDTSCKIEKASTLGSIGFAQELKSENGKYNININGTSFEFTDDTTVSEMVNKINSSDAGVKMTFNSVSQSFTLETKDTGAGQELNIYQTGGNLLNALFNMTSDEIAVSKADSAKIEYTINDKYTQKISNELRNALTTGFAPDAEDLKVKLKVDGLEKEYTINIDNLKRPTADTEINATVDLINVTLNKTFRADGIELSYNDGSLTFSSSNHKIEICENDLGLETGHTNEKLVTGDKSYMIAPGVDKMEFKVGDETVTVNASTADGTKGIRINDLVEAGLFTIRGDGTLVATKELSAADDNAKALLNKYFDGKETLKPAGKGDSLTAFGSNSTLVLSSDGGKTFTTYTSATNSFKFEGTNIDLVGVKDFNAESEDDYITVDTSKDTSAIKDIVKGFVEDYNKLLDDLYGEVNTARPKSKGAYFDPLTEEQEEDMKDEEIEKWNENAKKGLLYRDSNVTKFLSEIRGAMSTYIDGFGLYNMGVKLTDRWQDNGKLEIDEAKLESAIEANGDKIAELFTDPDKGIAARLEKVVNKAISTDTKKYGYLTSLAGQKNTKTDTDNQIYKQIQSIKDIIDKLEEKYEDEQERYWSQFTALEKYMAQMQQQSSYFTQTTM